jgi:hypothetical protein
VPQTIQIIGGRPPYTIGNSEPALMPLPLVTSDHSIEVVPANPGVIDAGLKPEELPVRTVNITVRDASGNTAAAAIKVGQNFLTGYGIALGPSTCAATGTGAAAAAPTACAGGDTVVRLAAVNNGNIHGNEAFRLQVLRGNFSLRNPATGQVSDTLTTNSDHGGIVTGIISVPVGALTQIGVLRVIHVPTGVYVDEVFVITGTGLAGALTAIPTSLTFTGPLSNVCGTGEGDILVFDGVPPYTATSTSNLIVVTPSVTNANPGRFTVTVTNRSTCVDGTVVITDSLGKRVTVAVKSEVGSGTLPALAVAPTTITLACGTSGSVSAVGGTGGYSVASSHPRVTAVASGGTITITRLSGDGAGIFPTSGTVSVSDGASVTSISVTVPANCP